jgi:hypothetical protein
MNKPICKTDQWGTEYWYLNDKLHREDGPAMKFYAGAKFWYLYGKRHREDGPAIEWANGAEEWWYYGKKLNCRTQEEFKRLLKLKAFW